MFEVQILRKAGKGFPLTSNQRPRSLNLASLGINPYEKGGMEAVIYFPLFLFNIKAITSEIIALIIPAAKAHS